VRAGAGDRGGEDPPRSPKANAYSERWVRTVRSEVTDRMLIAGPRHLCAVLDEYVTHYNRHRPHRARNLRPLDHDDIITAPVTNLTAARIQRRKILGGLIPEYETGRMTITSLAITSQVRDDDEVLEPCRRELPDRTLAWNQRHLKTVLREYGDFCSSHRPHRALDQAAPLRSLPDGVTGLDHFRVRRHGRADGVIHEYHLVGIGFRHLQVSMRPATGQTAERRCAAGL
jgi:hypothetical protein